MTLSCQIDSIYEGVIERGLQSRIPEDKSVQQRPAWEKYCQSHSSIRKELPYGNFVNRVTLFQQTLAQGPDLSTPPFCMTSSYTMEGRTIRHAVPFCSGGKQSFTAWHDVSVQPWDAEKPPAALNTRPLRKCTERFAPSGTNQSRLQERT